MLAATGRAKLTTNSANAIFEASALVQATAAEVYGLGPDDLAHVLATFPLIPADERAGVMEAFVSGTPQRSSR